MFPVQICYLSALRGLWGRKVRGACSERLVPEDYSDRWDLWDLLELGIQDLQDLKAVWESLDSEEILENQVRESEMPQRVRTLTIQNLVAAGVKSC